LGLVKIVTGWIRGKVGLWVGKIRVDVKFFVSGTKKFDIEDDNGWLTLGFADDSTHWHYVLYMHNRSFPYAVEHFLVMHSIVTNTM